MKEKRIRLDLDEDQLKVLVGILLDKLGNTQQGDTLSEVFEINKGAVVRVRVGSGKDRDSATGIIISTNGYLITAEHVVYDEEHGCFYPDIRMSFEKGGRKYKLRPVASSKSADIALCEFDSQDVTEKYSVIKLISDYSDLKVGDVCYIIGNTVDNGLSPVEGTVRQTKNAGRELQLNADINPGDSGAPVFNSKGECIGLVKRRMDKCDSVQISGIAYATTAERIKELLKNWFDGVHTNAHVCEVNKADCL